MPFEAIIPKTLPTSLPAATAKYFIIHSQQKGDSAALFTELVNDMGHVGRVPGDNGIGDQIEARGLICLLGGRT